MFEKQQKRMDHFTKESNGSEPQETQAPNPHGMCKGPGTKTKENMSQVVGEFKKVSADGNSPVSQDSTLTPRARNVTNFF